MVKVFIGLISLDKIGYVCMETSFFSGEGMLVSVVV